ncbi:MAG TPA: hypothetical protein VE954_28160 [Oligoflexus sp.]|uniref:hypothetical protein n=1 Tax=Oligoflexus sp. TaxID=1971216 RepID=UPI002D38B11A|nr:hypothetical protein [Oligoflexus sp.]HYX36993.1 hypothetical protein [Oligoflexus sp.]
MLPRLPFLPGGLALMVTACALPQPGLRRTTPIDHTLLRGDQLHTERQILEEREVNLLSAFGNLTALENRHFSVQLSSVLEAPHVDGSALRITRLVQEGSLLIVAYAGAAGSTRGALALIDLTDTESPVLRAELQLPTVAVETVALDGRHVYFAGSSSDPGGPVVGRISIQDFEWQDDLKLQALDLKSISALAVFEDRVVILDRDRSQLTTLNKNDFVTTAQVSVPGLSQLSQDASSLWTLGRLPTQIQQLDSELKLKSSAVALGDLENTLFSGQMVIGRETVMAALGDGGVRAFCKANQKALFNVPPVIRPDLPAEKTQSLDAGLSQGLLLTANADAGVYLYQVATQDKQGVCKEREIRFEGYLDLGKNFRAETLSWHQGVLSVGDGNGRLNLFSIDSDSLENDDNDFDG